MTIRPWQKDLIESIQCNDKKVIAIGRQTGKSQWYQLAKTLARMMERDLKIQWEILGNNRVRATGLSSKTHFNLLQESDMDPIQEWCEAHNCGIRTSFDTFKFRNKKQITMFMLKWA
jgi:hypothetical protein